MKYSFTPFYNKRWEYFREDFKHQSPSDGALPRPPQLLTKVILHSYVPTFWETAFVCYCSENVMVLSPIFYKSFTVSSLDQLILALSDHFNQLRHPRMPRVGNNRDCVAPSEKRECSRSRNRKEWARSQSTVCPTQSLPGRQRLQNSQPGLKKHPEKLPSEKAHLYKTAIFKNPCSLKGKDVQQ